MVHPETLLISAIIRTGDWKGVVNSGLTAEMFTLHKIEWGWIEKYVMKYGKPPSRQAFKVQFPNFKFYKADDLLEFADKVRKEWARSRMTNILDRAVDSLLAGNIESALSSLGQDVLGVQAKLLDPGADYDAADDWQETYRDVLNRAKRASENGTAGIPTGFASLDASTGGLQPGWFTVVGGRLGQGKTWTMIRMATEAVFDGYNTLYFSLEQSRHQIAMRSHSFMAKKLNRTVTPPLSLVKGVGFDLIEYKQFLQSLEHTLPAKLLINDTSRGKIGTLQVASAIEKHEPDIVFVDYLTLMSMNGDRDWRSVGQLSNDLKTLAEQYQIPIVVGSQVNRTAGPKEVPDPSQIAQSDAVGQDADGVVTLVRVSDTVMRMMLAKFRHGPDGIHWHVHYKPNEGLMEEISGDKALILIEQDKEVD